MTEEQQAPATAPPGDITMSLFHRFGPPLVLLLLVSIASVVSTYQLLKAASARELSYQNQDTLEYLFSDVKDIESVTRGFVITGDESYLDRYDVTLQKIGDQLSRLQAAASAPPFTDEDIAKLRNLVEQRLEISGRVVDARRHAGAEEAAAEVASRKGKLAMDELRRLIQDLQARQHQDLTRRQRQMQNITRVASGIIVASSLVAFGLVMYSALMVARDMKKRRQAEAAMEKANAELEAGIAHLEQRNEQITLLATLGEHLQVCQTTEEARRIVSHYSAQLFPQDAGAVYMFSPLRDMLEVLSSWGSNGSTPEYFYPDKCWALRRGTTHHASADDKTAPICDHYHPNPHHTYTCVPMLAQGQATGLLYLESDKNSTPAPGIHGEDRAKEQLVVTLAEQVGLALSNITLQEELRLQSIRDPLTGLFNRRYLEESLDRELRRTDRLAQPLSLMMLDIDHFKQFNDTYGHEAGDLVLRAVGDVLATGVRGEDIACRYGGEEFTIIMPGASTDIAAERAERIRASIARIHLRYQDRTLVSIHASVGIAAFPRHGRSKQALLEVADAALYRAKQQGRDQVVVA